MTMLFILIPLVMAGFLAAILYEVFHTPGKKLH